jgi:transketolase
MKLDVTNLALLAKTIRFLAVDAVQKANSGHPGMPMGAADYAAVLWSHYLRFNPKDPNWPNRDRFVLSAGHGSMLLYSLLHLFGYDLPLEQLKNFRQWESKTPGHPEFGWTPGVETTTGPLGQGLSNGVGLALSGKMLQARYGADLFAHRVFGIVSDGDMMEGVASEAASLAGHLKLDNLIYIYDDNNISIGGKTDVCFTESVADRFRAYGWHVQSIDGHDFEAIGGALDNALAVKGQPKLICARTTIGKGSPKKAGTSGVHGEPLGADEVKATKQALQWPEEPTFLIPKEVGAFCCGQMEVKLKEYTTWQTEFKNWEGKNSALAATYKAQRDRVLPEALKNELIKHFDPAQAKKTASRELSGQALQILAKHLPGLVGGSADLEPSTKTLIKDSKDVHAGDFSGKNLRFGVREHGMGAIANGLAYTGHWFPYTATFLVFSDYMRPVFRLAALSHLQTLFLFTHDSFWVGEDGPTHEPIEHVMSLRLIHGLYVFRPADGLETAMCYWAALSKKDHPSVLLFTRQGLTPFVRETSFSADDILKGGYVVQGNEVKDLVIVATGSEVSVVAESLKVLAEKGIKARLVSLPSWELFLEQPESYRNQVIPPTARKVSVEVGVTTGWEKIVGSNSLRIGIDHYGASAPGELLAEKFGFGKDTIAAKIAAWLR